MAAVLVLLAIVCFAQPLNAQPSGGTAGTVEAQGKATLEELATGLGRVSDLAIDGVSGDPLAVVWAEVDPPRIVRWTEADQQARDLESALPQNAAQPIRLLFTGPEKLLVSATVAEGKPVVSSVPCPAPPDADITPLDFDSEASPSPTPLVALMHNERYVFGVTQFGEVYRSRMVAGNFGMMKPLRSVAPLRPMALGLSARGYLTLVSSDPVDCPIDFFSPDRPEDPPALRVSSKLARVVDLAYGTLPRPKVRQLYVLNAGAASEGAGVYRIDASVNEGGMDCVAVLIVAVDRPRAMAFAPDGGLIVASEGEAPGAGRLLRVKGDL